MFYQEKNQLIDLLTYLVSIPSISMSESEVTFPDGAAESIMKIPYFKDHPYHVKKHPTKDGRYFLTALYKKENVKKTIVMISHFDVVNVDDYGILSDLAFSPHELKAEMQKAKSEFSSEVRRDLESEDWLFGRGTMDMKCGLSLHISMLEKAALDQLDGNLLLLTVPDEEVNSVGMREAVPALQELAAKYGLEYGLMVNSEPMFTLYPGDPNYYLYSGTIGKIMPGFYCYGQETHVGEPFSGLNATFMSSVITTEIELNTDFCETTHHQQSPAPTTLMQKDLKREYSVQIPHRSVSLYNVFMMNRSIEEIERMIGKTAVAAASKIEKFYHERKRKVDPHGEEDLRVAVYTFDELKEYAREKWGNQALQLEERICNDMQGEDEREISIKIVDEIAVMCKELAPMIVTFFAPPYYPAVSSHNDPLVQRIADDLIGFASESFGIGVQTLPFYNGISDLSYVSFRDTRVSSAIYERNTPGWGSSYYLPFKEMAELQVPVINVGPMGRDPHQKSERLNTKHAFEQVPLMLNRLVKNFFETDQT